MPETFSNLFNLGARCVSESYLRECKIKQSDKQSDCLRPVCHRVLCLSPLLLRAEHREQSKLLRAGARLRPLHQRFDVCTRHHRVTLQVFMRRIFFSFSFSRLSLLFHPVLSFSLSICLTLSPTLSTTSPFFPCSRFSCALLIAAECDPSPLSPLLFLSLSLSLVHFRWIINQLPLCEPRTNRRRDGKVIEPEIAGRASRHRLEKRNATPSRQARGSERERVVINR